MRGAISGATAGPQAGNMQLPASTPKRAVTTPCGVVTPGAAADLMLLDWQALDEDPLFDDIAPLDLLLALHARRYRRGEMRLSPGAEAALRGHLWPGNVRELRNVVQRAYVMAAEDTIDAQWLPQGGAPAPAPAASTASPAASAAASTAPSVTSVTASAALVAASDAEAAAS